MGKGKNLFLALGITLSLTACGKYIRSTLDSAMNKGNQASKEQIVSNLIKIFEKECDRVYTTKINGEEVIRCDKKQEKDKYVPECGINLEKFCDVYVKKKSFPILDWFWGDDLYVSGPEQTTRCLTMSGKNAKQASNLLQSYLNLEGRKCDYSFALKEKGKINLGR